MVAPCPALLFLCSFSVVLVGFKVCVMYTINKSAGMQSPCGTLVPITISFPVSSPIFTLSITFSVRT